MEKIQLILVISLVMLTYGMKLNLRSSMTSLGKQTEEVEAEIALLEESLLNNLSQTEEVAEESALLSINTEINTNALSEEEELSVENTETDVVDIYTKTAALINSLSTAIDPDYEEAPTLTEVTEEESTNEILTTENIIENIVTEIAEVIHPYLKNTK
jgi:hypothetical protein